MSEDKNLSSIRRDYSVGSLERSSLPADPYDLFEQWFSQAQKTESLDPTAMTLATYNQAMGPSARIVLLKYFDQKGFCWFTDYGSHKAQQLSEVPRAELLFYWPQLERQIRISGPVEKVTREHSVEYFNERPLGSRLSAAASQQSRVADSRLSLEQQVEALNAKFPDGNIPCPDTWGGFRLVADRYEFWQGRDNRLHDRFQFMKQASDWAVERLCP